MKRKYDNIVLYGYDLVDFALGLVPKILMTMLSTIFFLSQASYCFLTGEPDKRYDRKALNALAVSKALILGAHVKNTRHTKTYHRPNTTRNYTDTN
ncbi:MAG: hypothetical protein LRY30_01820, partial [Gammaproteobacteria bacterium]|nr:hypothetical protein [Gammaproteobacteria bacterium]